MKEEIKKIIGFISQPMLWKRHFCHFQYECWKNKITRRIDHHPWCPVSKEYSKKTINKIKLFLKWIWYHKILCEWTNNKNCAGLSFGKYLDAESEKIKD